MPAKQTLITQYHFEPRSGWMNDPNGLVYLDGEYHLFYQHNPAATVWGPMHWGHAVSQDLITWHELPIALYPDEIGTIFSGSCVIDTHNSAGFGARAMVAIFTHHHPQRGQAQSLAYSVDHGRTWAKYAHNPVLRPEPYVKDFRDPKVVWYETDTDAGHWVMILAAGQEIRFFVSSDLRSWQATGTFGAGVGSHTGVWETPELIKLPVNGGPETRWLLEVAVSEGAPAGGSGVQYFIGDFDGRVFTASENPVPTRWVDFGADFYAPQAWNNLTDGRTIWLGWMNNWSYANKIPDFGARRGAMSLPRELSLVHDDRGHALTQTPVRELLLPRMPVGGWRARVIEGTSIALPVSNAPNRELQLVFQIDSATTAHACGVLLTSAHHPVDNPILRVEIDLVAQQLRVHRTGFGDQAPTFDACHSAPLTVQPGLQNLTLILSPHSVEVFWDKGRVVMTELLFAEAGEVTTFLFATEGRVTIDSAKLFELN